MPYSSTDYSLCIWHVPKCGGSWLVNALSAAGVALTSNGNTHWWPGCWPAAKEFSYHAVTYRPALEWYSSTWRWMRRTGIDRRNAVAMHFEGVTREDLDDFPKFVLKFNGTHRRVVELYSLPNRTLLLPGADHAAAWLRCLGVTFDEKTLMDYPPRNVTEEEAPTIPDSLRRLAIE